MHNLCNLLQREDELEMISLCLEAGVGLIPYGPLARGGLAGARATERARQDKVPVTNDLLRDCDRAIVEAVGRIAAQRGIKPTQVALAWSLSRPAMASPIIGATQLQHIDDAAAATDVAPTPDEVGELEAPYRLRPAT